MRRDFPEVLAITSSIRISGIPLRTLRALLPDRTRQGHLLPIPMTTINGASSPFHHVVGFQPLTEQGARPGFGTRWQRGVEGGQQLRCGDPVVAVAGEGDVIGEERGEMVAILTPLVGCVPHGVR